MFIKWSMLLETYLTAKISLKVLPNNVGDLGKITVATGF